MKKVIPIINITLCSLLLFLSFVLALYSFSNKVGSTTERMFLMIFCADAVLGIRIGKQTLKDQNNLLMQKYSVGCFVANIIAFVFVLFVAGAIIK